MAHEEVEKKQKLFEFYKSEKSQRWAFLCKKKKLQNLIKFCNIFLAVLDPVELKNEKKTSAKELQI